MCNAIKYEKNIEEIIILKSRSTMLKNDNCKKIITFKCTSDYLECLANTYDSQLIFTKTDTGYISDSFTNMYTINNTENINSITIQCITKTTIFDKIELFIIFTSFICLLLLLIYLLCVCLEFIYRGLRVSIRRVPIQRVTERTYAPRVTERTYAPMVVVQMPDNDIQLCNV
jgi:hypothetical protein